jgi:hypothetical protein
MMMTKDIKSWPSHNWCPRNKTQTLSPSSPRPLELNMRLPWILVVSSLCAKVYGEDIQQVLGSSLDVSGASYTCAKGMLTFAVILISTNLFFFFKKKNRCKTINHMYRSVAAGTQLLVHLYKRHQLRSTSPFGLPEQFWHQRRRLRARERTMARA